MRMKSAVAYFCICLGRNRRANRVAHGMAEVARRQGKLAHGPAEVAR